MLTKLACLVFAFATSAASFASGATLGPAQALREDAQRIWYHDAELRIADLDLATSRNEVAMTRGYWDQAVERGDTHAAGTWAVRHRHAMDAEREAHGRVLLHRAEHNIARGDFERDANWVRAEAWASTRKRG